MQPKENLNLFNYCLNWDLKLNLNLFNYSLNWDLKLLKRHKKKKSILAELNILCWIWSIPGLLWQGMTRCKASWNVLNREYNTCGAKRYRHLEDQMNPTIQIGCQPNNKNPATQELFKETCHQLQDHDRLPIKTFWRKSHPLQDIISLPSDFYPCMKISP